MKTELSIDYYKDGKFIDCIVVEVRHTAGYSLGNGSYYVPDDMVSDSIDSIEMDGVDITDELIDMGISAYEILERCSGVSSSTLKTEVDITELAAQQLKNEES